MVNWSGLPLTIRKTSDHCARDYSDHLSFIVSLKHRLECDQVVIKELGGETFVAHNVVPPTALGIWNSSAARRSATDVEMPTINPSARWWSE
jgi:hypothetical protein